MADVTLMIQSTPVKFKDLGDGSYAIASIEQKAALSEDNAAQVIKVEQRYSPFYINTATTTVIKNGSGYIDEIFVPGGTIGAVTIYDNTAASGQLLLPTVTPVQGGVLLKHVTFTTGLTIVTATAMVIVGGYR